MITAENDRFVTTVGNFETAEFAVQRHNMRHLMSILRDQLYSDKKLAPIREYSCNAYDANVENGKKNVPIKVTLPTSLFPDFKIRDYGKGLSHEDMKNIFCSYGESTKRNSNEFIGQLGIGSKSGFAYGDNFLVTSFNEGKKTVYNCVVDKSGVGSLLYLTSEDSDEESGLEISIPVKNSDLTDFKVKALGFYKYWNVYPNVVGIPEHEINQYKIKDRPILSGDGWDMYARLSGATGPRAYVVMGNISYPINWDLIYEYSYRHNNQFGPFYNFLINNDTVIRVGIGDIEMAPSREALQYTPKTINSIRAKVDLIIQSLRVSINNQISSAKTIWDAKMTYGKLFGHIYDTTTDNNTRALNRQLEACFIDSLKWNNITINSHVFTKIGEWCHTNGHRPKNGIIASPLITAYLNTKKVLRCMNAYRNNYAYDDVICDDTNLVVINDLDQKNKINREVFKWYLTANPKLVHLYIFTFFNDTVKNNFYKTYNFETVPTVKLSTIVADYKKNKPKITRAKIAPELTQIGYVNLSTYYRSAHFLKHETVNLNDVPDADAKYVYSEDRVVTVNGVQLQLQYFLDDLKTINTTLDLKLDKVYIIGPRIKDGKKFDAKKWVDVSKIVTDAVIKNNYIENYINTTAYRNSVTMSRANGLNNKRLILSKSFMASILPKINIQTGMFKQLHDIYPNIDIRQTDRIIQVIQRMGLLRNDVYTPKVNKLEQAYNEMWTLLYQNYSMLKFINLDMTKIDTVIPAPLISEIAEYINVVDANKPSAVTNAQFIAVKNMI